MAENAVERIVRQLAELNEEVAASITPAPDIIDDRGQRWTCRDNDGIYRNGKGSAIPRAFLTD